MRGDSNMTDSSFMKSQEIVQKKIKKNIDNFNKEYKLREMKERWESGKGIKKTLWEKIKGIFNVE
tara:strand:+ start:200 stop:394 length:195 start_codon:yes stop_codon:yes gene_type:complete